MTDHGFVRGRGTGTPSIWSLGGHWTTLAGRADTDGRLALMEAIAYRTTEPPLHIHHHEAEAWYVIDGELTFRVGDRTLVASSGTFTYAPPGIPHAFTVDVEPTRMLVFAMPAGFEAFTEALGVPALDTEPPADLVMPAPDVLGPIAERYGIEVVGPPLRLEGDGKH